MGMRRPRAFVVVVTGTSFLVWLAVFGWLFSASFDQSPGQAVASSVAPALVAAGAICWALRREHRGP